LTDIEIMTLLNTASGVLSAPSLTVASIRDCFYTCLEMDYLHTSVNTLFKTVDLNFDGIQPSGLQAGHDRAILHFFRPPLIPPIGAANACHLQYSWHWDMKTALL